MKFGQPGYTEPVKPVASETPGTPEGHVFRYIDAYGNPTDDPALAVHGEITVRDEDGVRRRTRFFLHEDEMPFRSPVSEPALLLWVLVALIVLWLLIGLVLGLV
jgi:hypothetical protein